ncbi:MAG: carbohydrate ABC transporter permease [Clostridia bacterium]|nr:carbohydrate ABC transporter permease [Clostridia bacterium]
MKRSKASTVLLYALLIILTIIMVFPLVYSFFSSLRTNEEIFRYISPLSVHTLIPVNFTVEAYVRVFRDYGFLQPIWNTLAVCILSVFFGCLINSVAAMAFAMMDFKGKKLIYSVILITFMIPFESISLPMYRIAYKLNLLNTFAGIVLPGLASGMILFLFVQFFKDIPKEILEAAIVDGASLRHLFFRIIFPMSGAVFVTSALMQFMGQWNSYLWPLLVAQSKSLRLIQTRLTDFNAEEGTEWAAKYAAMVVSAIIPLGLFLPLQKYYVAGVTSGSIKG